MRATARAIKHHFDLFGIRGVVHQAALKLIPGINREFSVASPLSVSVRLGTSDIQSFEQVFKYGGYDLPLAVPPKVIIDAGANIGMASVYFARRYPDAKIIAIEPYPDNFEMLEKNVKRFPQITSVHAALWDKDGTISVYPGPGGSAWGIRVGTESAGFKVRSFTLGSLLKEMNISHVDLLKIDVEGSEREIFSEAETWISCVDAICVELHDQIKDGCTEAFENATLKFSRRWQQGELSCVARG